MATQTFSANSAYVLEATASRSGTSITVTTKITKTSGSGYYGGDTYLWRTIIDGTTYDDSWGPYNFSGSTPKTITLGSKTRSGLGTGTRSWSVLVNAASSLGSASVSGSVTIPSSAPAAPTIQTPVRNSDTSHTIKWARNATATASYTSQEVQRKDFDGTWSDWKTITVLRTNYTTSGNMSFTDRSTRSNRVYQYRVAAANPAGVAYSGITETIFTTPADVTQIYAVRQADNTVKLSWTNPTVYDLNYETTIRMHTSNGSGDKAYLGTGVTTYTDTTPFLTDGSLRYSIYVTAKAAGKLGDGLTSTPKFSDYVPISTAPNPPTNLSPNGLAFPADTAQKFSWKYNTADTSDQSAYEVNYRIAGTSTWTTRGKIQSPNSFLTYDANTFVNGNEYEWRVRTWGADSTLPSQYSAVSTFIASSRPEATNISPLPGELIPTANGLVKWTYFDAEGTDQSAWEAGLLDPNDTSKVMEVRTGTTQKSTTFQTSLENNTMYQWYVKVRDGNGVWSWPAYSSFQTSFSMPPRPIVSFDWDSLQGAVLISIDNPAPGSGEVAAIRNQIKRTYDDGETWETVTSNAPVNSAIADREVRLGSSVRYRVYAWSALPSSSPMAQQTYETPGDMGYWSADIEFGVAIQLKIGLDTPPAIDLTTGLANREIHYFAGRTLPVEFAGTAVNRTGEVSFLIIGEDLKRLVERLSLLPAPHLFRLPDGLQMYASPGDVNIVRVARSSYTVSLPIQEVSR